MCGLKTRQMIPMPSFIATCPLLPPFYSNGMCAKPHKIMRSIHASLNSPFQSHYAQQGVTKRGHFPSKISKRPWDSKELTRGSITDWRCPIRKKEYRGNAPNKWQRGCLKLGSLCQNKTTSLVVQLPGVALSQYRVGTKQNLLQLWSCHDDGDVYFGTKSTRRKVYVTVLLPL